MNTDEKILRIRSAIYEMGLLFNQQPSEERIEAYSNALKNYQPHQIKHAFEQIILSGSAFFPSLAEILTHLRPKESTSEDIGNFVANEVIERVRGYGRYRIKEAFDALSDMSKQVLANNTSLLMDVADSDPDNLPTIRAQIRNLAKATADAHKFKKANEKLRKIGIDTSNVIEFRPNELKKVTFDKLLPGDEA